MNDRLDAALDELGAAIREVRGQQPATPTGQPAPVPVPPGPPPVDLARWKLTLPVRSGGKVVEIKPPALATYGDRYFTRLPDGALRFRCPHAGDTTENSPNGRSELRELNTDGSLAAWSMRKGRHGLLIAGQVDRLTDTRPHVVLGQIHGGSDDVTVWRREGDKLWITRGDDTHAHLVAGGLQLGQRYLLGMATEPTSDGKAGIVRYTFNGAPVPFTLTSSAAECFFRAGAYVQSNRKSAPGASTDEYADVVVHGIDLRHAP